MALTRLTPDKLSILQKELAQQLLRAGEDPASIQDVVIQNGPHQADSVQTLPLKEENAQRSAGEEPAWDHT